MESKNVMLIKILDSLKDERDPAKDFLWLLENDQIPSDMRNKLIEFLVSALNKMDQTKLPDEAKKFLEMYSIGE